MCARSCYNYIDSTSDGYILHNLNYMKRLTLIIFPSHPNYKKERISCLYFFLYGGLCVLQQEIKCLKELGVGRELEDNSLASELLVHGRESIELVLQRGGILGIKETKIIPSLVSLLFIYHIARITYALMVLVPSTATRVRLPTSSEG